MTWAPTYCTRDELKNYLRIPLADTTDDVMLDRDIEAASRAIDFHCNRQFGLVATPEIRYFTPRWYSRFGRYIVDIDDLMTQVAAVILLDSAGDLTYAATVDLTKCQFTPLNAAPKGRPWTRVVLPQATSTSEAPGAVKMTASWGWTAVPVTVKEACLMQAARFTKRRDAPFGIVGNPESATGEQRLLQKLDVDVAQMLKSYVAFWAGV